MNNERLTVALCEFAMLWNSPEMNMRMLERSMEWLYNDAGLSLAPDIIVFPETFLTGFSVDPSFAVDPHDSREIGWMREMASRFSTALAGSLPVVQDGKMFNRLFFVTTDGEISHYDKRHLFRMSPEAKFFSAGDARTIFTFGSWNIALNICYDLRFPVWSRNVGKEYDMMINVASWPFSRIGAATALCRARAIENQAYYLFANRTGDSPSGLYNGYSEIYDYKGNGLSTRVNCHHLGDDGCFKIAHLDLGALRAFREKFPAWMDCDNFNIIK